jgi:hypothetical protein
MSPADSESERTVEEWLRHIQVEWELRLEQMAGLLHLDEARVSEILGPKVLMKRDGTAVGGTVPPGFESAVPLIAIYRRLAARFPKTEDQVKWLFTEHQDFGGTKPIDVAASSLENLYWIGYYLDAARR